MSEEKQNDWALNINGRRIHISQAESGRKGYYCPACSQEMIASRSKIIRSHFKHDFRDVEHKGECTFSNESYRHKIGKEILQRIKKIKVPALKKYPPKGEDGRPMRIRQSETIKAHTVEIELPFYENENGVVMWGREKSVEEKHLLIQPDVAFFDKSGNPTLLIELVATHKPDNEKLAKLNRLGINTVLVRLPKGTEEEIEETFAVSTRTRWAYHYDEQNTEYISVSTGNKNDLSEVDVEQRKLFEETFECRAAEVRNLLRAIKKCLGGEHYRTIEGEFRQEISRVEGIARAATGEVQKLRYSIRTEAERSVGDRRGTIEDRRRALSDRTENLGRRYRTKKSEIAGQIREIEKQTELVETEIRSTIKGLGGGQGSYREQGEELEKLIEQAKRDFQIEKRRRETIQSKQAGLAEEFELAERQIRADITRDTKRKTEVIEGRRESIRDEQETLPGQFKRDKRRVEEEESGYLRRALEHLQGKGGEGFVEMPRRYTALCTIRESLRDYHERYSAVKRFVQARRSFNSGSYKKWYKSR